MSELTNTQLQEVHSNSMIESIQVVAEHARNPAVKKLATLCILQQKQLDQLTKYVTGLVGEVPIGLGNDKYAEWDLDNNRLQQPQ